MNISLIRPKQLAKELGIPMSSLYRWMDEDPSFPRRIKLGPRSVAFKRSDVEAWINANMMDHKEESEK